MLMEAAAGLGGALAMGVGWHLSPYPWKVAGIRRLRERCVRNGWVALTFDDGPGKELTPRVLDLLGEFAAPATFFLLGRKVNETGEIIERMVAAGHEIGCHSMNHLNAWKCFPHIGRLDVREGFEALGPWRSDEMLYRPPYGKLSFASSREVQRHRGLLAWWTIDSGDTFKHLPSPELAADRLKSEGGGVILLHDFDRRSEDRHRFALESTRLVLETVKREGLSIRKLGDILKSGQ